MWKKSINYLKSDVKEIHKLPKFILVHKGNQFDNNESNGHYGGGYKHQKEMQWLKPGQTVLSFSHEKALKESRIQ